VGQRQALVRDERNAGNMASAVERSGFPGDHHPTAVAVDTVLDSTSEHSISVKHGVLSYEADALERVAARAGIDPPEHPVGYQDRHGRHHLPWDCALALAEAFARNEPSTVLDPIDTQEHEWATEARSPGHSYLIGLLTEYRAAWAIVRQWAGHDAAIAAREARITDLERLLTSVMWDLRRPILTVSGSPRASAGHCWVDEHRTGSRERAGSRTSLSASTRCARGNESGRVWTSCRDDPRFHRYELGSTMMLRRRSRSEVAVTSRPGGVVLSGEHRAV
jgi:hypothetical protein